MFADREEKTGFNFNICNSDFSGCVFRSLG